ncbi:MAG: 30S ribosomal protein S17 [Candidatus Aenigmatarchaeota archaeon]|nr:MAG: 30S ribosomal protein S17 [Candidatus Aenigmarchaeota archaeon]
MKNYNNLGLEANPPEKTCNDKTCPWHGHLKVRGRVFIAKVVNDKNRASIVVEWPYTKFVHKYERYEKRKTKITVHNPKCIDAKKGDYVKIAECRPISKTKHFVVIEKIKK